jgi:hypothetical protein
MRPLAAHHDFNNQMRAESDDYYYANYVRWYNTEPFRAANGRIPDLGGAMWCWKRQ